jgi:hypothetical protein
LLEEVETMEEGKVFAASDDDDVRAPLVLVDDAETKAHKQANDDNTTTCQTHPLSTSAER